MKQPTRSSLGSGYVTLLMSVGMLLLACASLAQAADTARHRLHDDLPPPPLPPVFRHHHHHHHHHHTSNRHGRENFRFAEARTGAEAHAQASEISESSMGTGDITKTLYNVLAKNRDATVDETTQLMQDYQNTKKRETDLEAKRDMLKNREEMLTRLQFCLESDSKRAKAISDASEEKLANQTAPGVTLEELQRKQQELNQLESMLKTMKMQLERKEADLKLKEKKLSLRIDAIRSAEAEIEQRAADPNYKGSSEYRKSHGLKPLGSKNNSLDECPPPPPTFCPGQCEINKDCGSCVEDPKCGWCRSSQSCMSVLDGNIPAGNCSHSDFSHLYCKSFTCEQHSTCQQCLSDPECGRCAATGMCQKGSLTGPSKGVCPSWNFAAPMRFFSLNIYGKDTSNVTERAGSIFAMVEEANADFIMFQEVEDWFLELMASQKWAKSYHASDFGSGHAPGGLLILSKVPLAQVSYYEKTQPGQVEVDQRGRLLTVKPKLGDLSFTIATTTMDWRSPESRADSLEYVFSVLNNTATVVLGGDLNFDFGAQPESSKIPDKFKDVWIQLRPDRPGFTWDPLHNSYARASDPRSRPSRIDRMLVSSSYVNFHKISKVGSKDVSPHYGLLADIQLFAAFC